MNEDYPKIRNVSETEEKDALINYLIALMNIKCSSKEESDSLSVQMLVILDFINSKFGFLTIPEIKEAFRMYVAKDFGHKDIFRTLDTIVVSDVLNCFLNYRGEKLRAYNAKIQKIAQTQPEIDSEKKYSLMTDAIINCFHRFKETNDIEEPFVFILEELVERKFIKINNNPKVVKYYEEVYDKAKVDVLMETKKAKAQSKTESNAIKNELEKILNNQSVKITIRQYKLVLIDFFTKQIRENTDFENLLIKNNKQNE